MLLNKLLEFLMNGIKGFSKGVAEAIVLGKDLNESFERI